MPLTNEFEGTDPVARLARLGLGWARKDSAREAIDRVKLRMPLLGEIAGK